MSWAIWIVNGGLTLVVLLLIGRFVGYLLRLRRADRLRFALMDLRREVRYFFDAHEDFLTQRDAAFAYDLMRARGTITGRVARLERSFKENRKAERVVSISRHGIDAVEAIIDQIDHPQLYRFYRRYQQILLDGLEMHLPAAPLGGLLPPEVRIALLPEATGDRELRDLAQWYTQQAVALRA